MDRIEMQGTNGMRARLAAKGVEPVARSERLRPAAGDAGQSHPVELAAIGLAGAQAPVDQERVARIREAVEQGSYPLLPHRVADELIAAGFILRNGK